MPEVNASQYQPFYGLLTADEGQRAAALWLMVCHHQTPDALATYGQALLDLLRSGVRKAAARMVNVGLADARGLTGQASSLVERSAQQSEVSRLLAASARRQQTHYDDWSAAADRILGQPDAAHQYYGSISQQQQQPVTDWQKGQPTMAYIMVNGQQVFLTDAEVNRLFTSSRQPQPQPQPQQTIPDLFRSLEVSIVDAAGKTHKVNVAKNVADYVWHKGTSNEQPVCQVFATADGKFTSQPVEGLPNVRLTVKLEVIKSKAGTINV